MQSGEVAQAIQAKLHSIMHEMGVQVAPLAQYEEGSEYHGYPSLTYTPGPCTYIYSMKEKITLSVDAEAKRKAEEHKQRTGMSLSEIFELGVAHLTDADAATAHPFEKLVGTLQFTAEDAQRKDRVGRMVRRIRSTRGSHRRKQKRA